MRILVTGSAGRIGGPVCAALHAAGHEVVGFDRVRAPRGRTIVGEHTDLGQLVQAARGCAAIVHLSAIPSPGGVPDLEVFRTNVLGTYNAHAAAAALGMETVVSTSSQSAFGWAWGHRVTLPRRLPIDESEPDEPDDDYGLSKQVGEQIAASFHRKTGMRALVVRPPLVASPGDDLSSALASPDWRPCLFSYIDVRDLAEVFRLAVERQEVRHEVFNVCADDALATEPLASLLPRLDPRFADVPGLETLIMGRPMVDNARAKRLLGWSPRYTHPR